jgi:small subunit ribosomal protein S14
MFRSKKLDLGCFVNVKVLRDHTKRKVFEQNEIQRYESISLQRQTSMPSQSTQLTSMGLVMNM